MARSRSRSKASRRFASEGRLPSVIIGSARRRSSFALGSVVRISSWRSSDTVMLRSIARRCAEVRLSLRRPWPWRISSFLPSFLGAMLEAGRRPVLELHAKCEPARSEHFLDLVERLAAEVGRLEKLGLGALDEIADVVDVLGLEAVGRAHGELQVVDRAQQDRIDRRRLRLLGGHRRALELREDGELVDQHARGVADRLFRLDGTVGLEVHDQLVEVGALLDARRFHRVRHAAHRAERGIEDDAADAFRLLRQVAHVARHVAAARLDLDLHLELAAGGDVRDDVVWIDDFDVVRRLDVGGGDSAVALFLEREDGFGAVMQAEDHAFEVEQDVYDILAHAIERRVLVHDAGDLHLRGRVARHRGEQHATQRVAQRVAIAPLERLHRYPRVVRREILDVDNTRLEKSGLRHVFGSWFTARLSRSYFAYYLE